MKAYILVFFFLIMGMAVYGQTWKTEIQRISGRPMLKTLKLKSGKELQVATLLKNADSIQESRYYNGTFQGFINDSLWLKITSIENRLNDARGLRQSIITQTGYYTRGKADSVYRLGLAQTDIHFISYQTGSQKFFAAPEDAILFASLAMIIVSPFFCYNYREGSFNAERYKYWALGGTAGIMVGFSCQILGSVKRIQFRPDWPQKGAKVWRFK